MIPPRGLADRLVAEKYLRRVAGKKDRRQVFLTLTSRGDAVLEKLTVAHREQLRTIASQLNHLLEICMK